MKRPHRRRWMNSGSLPVMDSMGIAYEAPALVDAGSVGDLTLAGPPNGGYKGETNTPDGYYLFGQTALTS